MIVALLCRNKAKELPYVIDALASGSLWPELVILCDDDSDDGSVGVFVGCCKESKLERWSVQSLGLPARSTRWNLSSLRNLALRRASEEINIGEDALLFLDADMVVNPLCLAAHRNLRLYNAQRAVTTGPRFEFARPLDVHSPVNFHYGHEGVSGVEPKWSTTYGAMFSVNVKAALELGGFDEDFDGAYGLEDLDFMYRAHCFGWDFRGDFRAHAFHLPHPHHDFSVPSANWEKWKRKHGDVKPVLPEIESRLSRARWSDYYAKLEQTKAIMDGVKTAWEKR